MPHIGESYEMLRTGGSGGGGTGPMGPTGPAGPANSLAIGTVTTGAAGAIASATITGTAPSQTLNLTIPRGDTGASAMDAAGTWSLGVEVAWREGTSDVES